MEIETVLKQIRRNPAAGLWKAEAWHRNVQGGVKPAEGIARCLAIGDAAAQALSGKTAVKWYDRALAAADRAGDPTSLAHVGRALGGAFANAGRIDELAGLCAWADRHARGQPAPPLRWLQEHLRGELFALRRERDLATRHFRIGIEHARKNSLHAEAASSFARLAWIFFVQGRVEEAATVVREATSSVKDGSDPEVPASMANLPALIEIARGRWEAGLLAAAAALRAFRETSEWLRTAQFVPQLIQMTLTVLPAHSHQETLLQGVMKHIGSRDASQRFIAQLHLCLGWVRLYTGKVLPALSSFERASLVFDALTTPELDADALCGMGEALRRLGRGAEAKRVLGQARDLARDLPGGSRTAPAVLVALAQADLDQDDVRAARFHADWARAKLNDADLSSPFAHHLAWFYRTKLDWIEFRLATGSRERWWRWDALKRRLREPSGRLAPSLSVLLLEAIGEAAGYACERSRVHDARHLLDRGTTALETLADVLAPHDRWHLRRAPHVRTFIGNLRVLRAKFGPALCRIPAHFGTGSETAARTLEQWDEVCRAAGFARPASRTESSLGAAIRDAERGRILDALREIGGNRAGAARKLGISRNALYAKMRRLGIRSRKV